MKTKNLLFPMAFACLTIINLVSFSSCGKDEDTGGGGQTNNTTADFVNVNGTKIFNLSKGTYTTKNVLGDTTMDFTYGDSNVIIAVAEGYARKSKTYTTKLFPDAEISVSIGIKLGNQLSSPEITLDGGNCEFKRENNKWVLNLSNGTGINSTNSQRVNNISFKLTFAN